MTKDRGSYWFIHYSFMVKGKLHEASIIFEDPATKHFRYQRMRDVIQNWLNKAYEGDLSVVIRNFFEVSKETSEEFWSRQPEESYKIEDITKI